MAFSIQTNVNSLVAQENLRVNSNFQSQTIQRLTSGYRINSSGDDAAGLAVANKFRSDVAEITQGVRNANDGVSQLQIVDSGMSNIAKMLDRLRTLATQSASSTFTGDRSVLNSEFQSLLTEIDRQSQSIGLNQNGSFAKSLSVFIGGGRTATTSALDTTNGTVTVDLRASTVDTTSLGLKGTQVKGGVTDVKAAIDLGANTKSADSKADFYFSGIGFSDSGKIKVALDTTGITNMSELADALNTAITTAGNQVSDAASKFKAAGIVAGVYTDPTTKDQTITFTSASTAFQVEGGDKMANALLGNIKASTNYEGIDTGNTVTAASAIDSAKAVVPANVKVRITGGGIANSNGYVDLSLTAGTFGDTAAANLKSLVNNDATLAAAGITVTSGTANGNTLAFTNSHGEKFNVMVTGDTTNALGFGAYLSGSTPAADYTTYTGNAYTATSMVTPGTATLSFSIDGGATAGAEQVSVDLAQGDAVKASKTYGSATFTATETLQLQIDGASVGSAITIAASPTATSVAAQLQAQIGAAADASVDGAGNLVITAKNAGAHVISFVGTGAGHLGTASASVAGQARSGDSIAQALTEALDAQPNLAKAGLKAEWTGAAVKISSDNGTNFRMNASGVNADIGFGLVTAATWNGVGGNAAQYNKSSDANGTSNTQGLAFSAMKYGSDTQTITVYANDSTNAVQSLAITLQNNGTTRTGRTIDEAVKEINRQLQGSNNATLKQILAVKDMDGSGGETINFVSSLKSFSVALGASANTDGFTDAGSTGTTVGSKALGSGGNLSIDSESKAVTAVTSVNNALAALGVAQATVGKGQNQLNYAIGLAQSQINNFSSAESRIRDADVASEAANLTKASVLQQASIAAMAQANSAPQAVLSLLRG
jgi:flagellin